MVLHKADICFDVRHGSRCRVLSPIHHASHAADDRAESDISLHRKQLHGGAGDLFAGVGGIQPTPEELEEEYYFDSLELLACCVEAEAGNQDLLGKRMVASVILNRVDDEDWPDSIVEVITQPYQFTTWWNGAIEKAEPSEETFEAVRMELEERSYPGLFYFCSTGYSEYGTPWKKVGDHYFSTK